MSLPGFSGLQLPWKNKTMKKSRGCSSSRSTGARSVWGAVRKQQRKLRSNLSSFAFDKQSSNRYEFTFTSYSHTYHMDMRIKCTCTSYAHAHHIHMHMHSICTCTSYAHAHHMHMHIICTCVDIRPYMVHEYRATIVHEYRAVTTPATGGCLTCTGGALSTRNVQWLMNVYACNQFLFFLETIYITHDIYSNSTDIYFYTQLSALPNYYGLFTSTIIHLQYFYSALLH
eukprot:GHVS01015297.1.p1 GENE.GHVS01015297.1~~GHVS01015297.1.p1  ORF type:complete len:257 (+),score=2.02 GHVS01015297.1:89-772(+)